MPGIDGKIVCDTLTARTRPDIPIVVRSITLKRHSFTEVKAETFCLEQNKYRYKNIGAELLAVPTKQGNKILEKQCREFCNS